MTVRILVGDVREQLATLVDESVHCIVTSPPYWGLRDYKTEPVDWPAIDYQPMSGVPCRVEIPAMACSLGLEPTPEAFIGHMVLVFRELWRVLRADGTAWVNMDAALALRVLWRNKRSVWTMVTKGFKGAHFATFPPELPETCIKAGCPIGGTVLDPFFGAGTTGLVADRLGRNAIGIELSPEYADMARRRIQADSPLLTEVSA